jgi:hypothetical protein
LCRGSLIDSCLRNDSLLSSEICLGQQYEIITLLEQQPALLIHGRCSWFFSKHHVRSYSGFWHQKNVNSWTIRTSSIREKVSPGWELGYCTAPNFSLLDRLVAGAQSHIFVVDRFWVHECMLCRDNANSNNYPVIKLSGIFTTTAYDL